MNTELLNTLHNYGFSEKEAKIYLTCCELGPTLASTISRNAEEKRVTTYSILKELVKKGYIQEVTKNNTKYFSALSPEILCNDLEKKYLKFKESLPAFLSIFEQYSDKTKIQFFEGISGLEKLFEEFSNSTVDTKKILGTPRIHNDILLEQATYYRKKRNQKGLISWRIVSPHNVDPKTEKEHDKRYGRKTIIVKDFPFDINADINIFGPNKVSFLFFENDIPHAVLITNENLYHCLLTLFDYIRYMNTKKAT